MSTHICFVAPSIWPILSANSAIEFAGGAEVQQAIVARALVRAGMRVTVIALDYGQPDDVVVDGIRVLRTHKPDAGVPGIRFLYPRLSSCWQAMRRANADVFLQSTASYLTGVVAAFCKLNKIPFIYYGASDPDFQADQTWKKFQRRGGWRDLQMYLWGLKKADAIVAQHTGQVASCERWYGRAAVEIPNCYQTPPGSKASSNGVVLWVAIMRSLKRPELFLELARELRHLQFRIVGGPGPGKDASLYDRMKEEAATLPNLEFKGFVPFPLVEAQFDEASIFVNTSDYEGFPNTFLQSWARGIPTVSFFDCGAREGGRPVGFVCKDLSEMKEIVSRLSNDKAFWEQESSRVLQYFKEHHTVDFVVQKYVNLADKLVATSAKT